MQVNLKQRNSKKQGDVGLGVAIAWFTCQGHTVCIPLTDSQGYDLVVDMGAGLKTVQVKTTNYQPGNTFQVNLRTMGGNRSRSTIKKFDKEATDFLFVVTGEGAQYLIPCKRLQGRSTLSLGKLADKFRL